MKPAYVFDLDGTLVDTAPDLRLAVNRLMARENRRAIALEEMRFLIGDGLKKLIERAFARTGATLDPARLDGLYAEFLGWYGVAESRPFPGVVETLERLAAEGARLAVLTNKPQQSADQLLAALDLARFFAVVVGGGRHPWLKPDGRLYADVLAELGAKGASIMVGDSRPDVETARNAGVPVVVLSYGYSAEPYEGLGADLVIDRFAEVPAAAARLWSLSDPD